MSFDPIQVPMPNTILLYAGEISKKYVSPNQSASDGIWKVALYVVTLGLFPDIAILNLLSYQKVQKETVEALKNKAAESLDGALWVSNHVKLYRLHEDEKQEILEIATTTIGTNYPAFLEKIQGQSSAQWFKNFEMQDPSHTKRTAAKVAKLADKLGSVDTDLLKTCIKEYELNHDQSFEIIKAAAEKDHDVLKHFSQFKFTEDELHQLGAISKTTLVKKIGQIADADHHPSTKAELMTTYLTTFTQQAHLLKMQYEHYQEMVVFLLEKFSSVGEMILNSAEMDAGKKKLLSDGLQNFIKTMNAFKEHHPQAATFDLANINLANTMLSNSQTDAINLFVKFIQQSVELYNTVFAK